MITNKALAYNKTICNSSMTLYCCNNIAANSKERIALNTSINATINPYLQPNKTVVFVAPAFFMPLDLMLMSFIFPIICEPFTQPDKLPIMTIRKIYIGLSPTLSLSYITYPCLSYQFIFKFPNETSEA